jgi:hypothetical protein
MKKAIKIRHTESGLEGEIMPSSLRAWERNGWTAVEDGSSEEVPATGGKHADKVQPDPDESKE